MYFNDSNEKPIKQVIKELYKRYQIGKKMDEQTVIHHYPQVVGTLIHKYTESVFIRDGVLFLRISSPVIKNEINYAKEKLCKSLNEAVGKEVVRKIVLI